MKNTILLGSFLIAGILLSLSCKKKEPAIEYARITIGQDPQVLASTYAKVQSVFIPAGKGWLAVHHDDGTGQPDLTRSFPYPLQILKQSNSNISLPVYDTVVPVQDGEQVWIVLHKDDGESGRYEYNTSGREFDGPVKGEDGKVVAKPLTVISPFIYASDQPLTNNTLTIDSVLSGNGGWILVRPDVPPFFGQITPYDTVAVPSGKSYNHVIRVNPANGYGPGDELYIILCIEKDNNGRWDNFGGDIEDYFGDRPIYDTVKILP